MTHPRYDGAVVDVHCHWDSANLPQCHTHMDEAGIDLGVHLWDVTWPPRPFEEDGDLWDRFGPRLARCFVPDLSVVGHAGFEAQLEAKLRAAAAAGAVGVKVWKNLGLHLRDSKGHRVAVDDARLDVLWDTAADVGLPIAIHVGDHPLFWQPLTPSNPRYQELVDHPEFYYGNGGFPELAQIHHELEAAVAAHPGTTFIGLHFGCFMSWSEMRRMFDTYRNYNVDTATALCDMGHPDSVQTVRQLLVDHPDRILFGSDLIRTNDWFMPDDTPIDCYYHRHWRVFETDETQLTMPLTIQGDWTLEGLDLPVDALQAIYRDNALRLFNFSAEARAYCLTVRPNR